MTHGRTVSCLLFLSVSLVSLNVVIAGGASTAATGRSDSQSNYRVLRFPDDHSVGTVLVRPKRAGTREWREWYTEVWSTTGPARGEVRVAADADAQLQIDRAVSKDLTFLTVLRPDDVQVIDLSDADTSDDQLRHLGHLTGLRVLFLFRTGIGDSGLQHLSRLEHLEEIHLNGTKITDVGMTVIAGLKNLRFLQVPNTDVGDAGLEHLTALPALQILVTGGGPGAKKITDVGLRHLGSMSSLKHLTLTNTQITDEGLSHLKHLTQLESLNLDGTRVTARGLTHLRPIQSLWRLRFDFPLTDEAAPALAEIKSLRNIDVNLEVTDKGLAALAQLPLLERISLVNRDVTDAGMEHLARMESLKTLWLQGCRITDSGLAKITTLPNLENLFLAKTRVSGDGLKHLASLPQLTQFRIDFGLREDDSAPVGLQHVATLTKLRDLTVEGEGLINRDLQHLAPLLKLESLSVGFAVDDKGSIHLGGLTSLKSLALPDCVITDAGLTHLTNLRALENLEVRGHFSDESVQKLKRLKALKTLTIYSPYVTPAGIEVVTREMPTLSVQDAGPPPTVGAVRLTEKDTIRRRSRGAADSADDAMESKPAPALFLDGWVNADAAGLEWEQLRGKVVVVDFWGTWCGPCTAAMPKLEDLHRKYHDEGLVILGVHTTYGGETMAEYVTKEQLPWPVAVDIDGKTAKAWGVIAYPSMYVIGRSGKVRVANPFPEDLERAVLQALSEN